MGIDSVLMRFEHFGGKPATEQCRPLFSIQPRLGPKVLARGFMIQCATFKDAQLQRSLALRCEHKKFIRSTAFRKSHEPESVSVIEYTDFVKRTLGGKTVWITGAHVEIELVPNKIVKRTRRHLRPGAPGSLCREFYWLIEMYFPAT